MGSHCVWTQFFQSLFEWLRENPTMPLGIIQFNFSLRDLWIHSFGPKPSTQPIGPSSTYSQLLPSSGWLHELTIKATGHRLHIQSHLHSNSPIIWISSSTMVECEDSSSQRELISSDCILAHEINSKPQKVGIFYKLYVFFSMILAISGLYLYRSMYLYMQSVILSVSKSASHSVSLSV